MKGLRPYVRRRHFGALAAGAHLSYTPNQIAALYQFPAVTSGTDPSIALIELGGGYRESDITEYFKAIDLPAPNVESIFVDGGANDPGQDENADIEVTLDILVAAAAYSYSTRKAANIKVFFAQDAGFANAISAAALHASKPCACSISCASTRHGPHGCAYAERQASVA